MEIWVLEQNFWDHFYKPNIPQKCWNCLLFEAFTTFGSVSSQFLNSVLFWQFLECEIAILGTPPVGGLKIVFFQKFFLILFYTTKLQYKSPGPIWKLKKWQKMAIKSPPYQGRCPTHTSHCNYAHWASKTYLLCICCILCLSVFLYLFIWGLLIWAATVLHMVQLCLYQGSSQCKVQWATVDLKEE